MKKRLNIYITDEVSVYAHELAEKTGLTLGAIGTLAFTAGLKSIEMAFNPAWQARFEEAFRADPDLFKKFMQEG